MVSGKKVVPVFGVVVLGIAAATIYTVMTRERGASSAFVEQVKSDARCNLLTAPGEGVRRQGVLALVKLHPEWGVDEQALVDRAQRMDVAGTGTFPGSTAEARLGFIELGWAMDGEDPNAMWGLRVRCEGEHVASAVPIRLPRGGERLRSQGTIMLPPTMRAFPAGAAPIPLIGPGNEHQLWRDRCAPTAEGAVRCEVDAFHPDAPGWFVPQLSYLQTELSPVEAPQMSWKRRVVEGVLDERGVTVRFEVSRDRAQVGEDCPEGLALVGPDAVDADTCGFTVQHVSATCQCGPRQVTVQLGSGALGCELVEGPPEGEELCHALLLGWEPDEP